MGAVHLVRARLFGASVPSATIRQTVTAYRFGLVGYVLAMLLALVWPVVSFVAYLGIALYYFVPHGADDDLAGDA